MSFFFRVLSNEMKKTAYDNILLEKSFRTRQSSSEVFKIGFVDLYAKLQMLFDSK